MKVDHIILALLIAFLVMILGGAIITGISRDRAEEKEQFKNEILSQIEQNKETATEWHCCPYCGKIFGETKERKNG